jgi:hypothetical protein
VRERCIYRQTNGEWSQYAHQNFSRLRFSTSQTPVSHPDQCSHIIHVTKRTPYLEVTSKVNITNQPNTAPTPLHNYTSCIGLSFLALPRHIQILTGDIPELPTPPPFDFEEPVDLIIATYGSVLFGVGYHGWVLTTKDETILLRGGGPDDGIQSPMTSYRSELGVLVAGLAVLGTLFWAGTMNIQSVRFICDSESVTAARRPKSESIFHNTKCDWDLIVTIQDLFMRWCNGIAFSSHWVKGHADLIDHPLTRDKRLNIEADLQADVIRAQARGPITAQSNCAHWDIEEASLLIRGSKVISDTKNQLHHRCMTTIYAPS